MDHITSAVLSPGEAEAPTVNPSPPSSLTGTSNPSILGRRLRVSINPDLIDKNESGDKALFASGWVNRELTLEELAREIDEGHAYCAQLAGSRRAQNFVCSDVLSVDIDGSRRIDEVMNDPIVQRCLTIFYTTPSHTEEIHRFRLVFALPRTIRSSVEMVAASRSLTLWLSGDPSATDAARLFYGSRGSRPQVFDRCMDEDLMNELIAQGMDADQSDVKDKRSRATTISRQAIPPRQPITTADGSLIPFEEIAKGRAVCCPFHHDHHASAFIVRSKSNVPGLHCSTCAQTFWAAGSVLPAYDFFDFEDSVRRAHDFFEKHQDHGALRELFPSDNPIVDGLTGSNISITQQEYLHIDRLQGGITFIKSPKGTGKTEQLRKLIANDSTLLIGHRISLIKQSCRRLGLECYLDLKGQLECTRLGICLDSLQRLRIRRQVPNSRAVTKEIGSFKTIVIDESEQVLSHFLSDTIEDSREACFEIFRWLLRKAKRVVVLDADLSWLSFETITKFVNDRSHLAKIAQRAPVKSHIYLNDRPSDRTIELYKTNEQLLAELMQQLRDGKRVFVTSNSKRKIDSIHAIAEDKFPDLCALRITSETTGADDVVAFIQNPATEALKYRLIGTSPSLSTGVDIAFPDKQQMIDTVFGFFECSITTHFEFDQQLSRVRHPGATKVWINPRTFRFDIARDVIKTELLQTGVYKNCLVEYNDIGVPVYHQDVPLIDMASHIVSQQRASKNNLKQHYIQLKRRQGFTVLAVEPVSAMLAEGQEFAKLGRELSQGERIEMLMSAPPLRKGDFETLEARVADNETISVADRWSMRRTSIERFYRDPICEELIIEDKQGASRSQQVLFENLLAKTRLARETARLTGDLRPALQLVGADKLAPTMRFLKSERDRAVVLYHLLHKTPLMEDGEWKGATLTSDDLGEFASAMSANKPIIENVLNIEVRADVMKKPMRQLNAVLDLVGLTCVSRGKHKSGRG